MKKLIALLLALVMVIGLVACGNNAEAPKADAPEAPKADAPEAPKADAPEAPEADGEFDPAGKKIGYIIYSNANESAYMYYAGLEKLCKEAGIEVLSTESNGDAEAMMRACDNFILQGVDAIVDSSWNAGGGAALVQKCNDAGIP